MESRADLLLNVVQHLSLGLHQNSHVQEDLVQFHQALLQLLHCLMPLVDLCQSIQHLRTTLSMKTFRMPVCIECFLHCLSSSHTPTDLI